MIVITGNTFDHRDTLKDVGARWNHTLKRWEAHRVNASELVRLRALVGCVVTLTDKENDQEPAPPREDRSSDIEDLVREALERRHNSETGTDGGYKTVIYGDDTTYFNYFKDINPRSFFGFSTFGQLLQYIDQIPHHARTGERDAGYETDDPKWTGSNSMAHARQIADDGWPVGVENAAAVLEAISVEHATQRRRRHSLAGGSVNVGRLLAGNPLHMRSRPKQPGRKVVTLFIAGGNSAYIEAESMIIRAAIIAAIADILEREGYSCEIVNVWTAASYGNKPAVQIATTLKQAGQKMNLPDLVFALGHPSFLRRFMFACVCSADELQHIWHSQGIPTNAFNVENMPSKSEFYIPVLSENVKGPSLIDKALKMLPIIEPLNLPVTIRKENERC